MARDEIVLLYADALRALMLLEEAGRGILGWEPWLKYPDGSHLHLLLGGSFEREDGEDWATYVWRSVYYCREALKKEQFHWDQGIFPGYNSALILYFCLVAASEEEWNELNNK